MSRACVLVAGMAVLGACTTVSEPPAASGGRDVTMGVYQVGGGQNAEYVFCVRGECPDRTVKRPPPKPKVPAPAAAVPSAVPSEEKAHFKVHFPWGWSRLDGAGEREIEAIVQSGVLARAKRIVVAGRTDPTGSLKFNEKLALGRAQTVKAALARAGVPAEEITAEAQAPCCDGNKAASSEQMRELRRTDIDITITTR